MAVAWFAPVGSVMERDRAVTTGVGPCAAKVSGTLVAIAALPGTPTHRTHERGVSLQSTAEPSPNCRIWCTANVWRNAPLAFAVKNWPESRSQLVEALVAAAVHGKISIGDPAGKLEPMTVTGWRSVR